MKSDLLKYKHYLLIISALLLANYALIPLAEFQEEQLQTLQLLEKKQLKTASLMVNSEQYSKVSKQLTAHLRESEHYLFTQKTVADFKLAAQSQVDGLLQAAGCDIERIGFKGSQKILAEVEKWFMEIRYKGDVDCLLSTTRSLEMAMPYINIEEYNYHAREFDSQADADFIATLKVSVWYKNNVLAVEETS
jgi:hypothetical protein